MATDSTFPGSESSLQGDILISTVSSIETGLKSSTSQFVSQTSAFSPAALSVDGIDLTAIAFDASLDHVLLGQSSIIFTLQNLGTVDADGFEVDIVYSDTQLLGNEDDIIVGNVAITSLASGETLTQSVDVTLPLDILNQRAQQDDITNQGSGYISSSTDYLGLIIDPNNDISEANEENNINDTKGRGADDITYFPWDIDGNGLITPTDAIFAINRLGQTVDETNAAADFDGSGQITPTDAIAAINRLGYGINPEVTTPVINVELGNDTGFEATDQITSDATLSGVIADVTEVSTFQARFAGVSDTAFVDITDTLGADGRFTLGPAELNTIFGGTLPEGLQTITLQTLDASGTVTSEVQLPFQLDTQGPTVSISPAATVSDTFTSFEVSFSEAVSEDAFDASSYGLSTEGGDLVEIVSVTQLSDSRARINLSTALPDDDYQFSVDPTVSDIAGNTVETTTPFSFSIFDPVSITELSPTNGEEMVTLNREAIIRFSKPVDPATVTSAAIKVIALGEEVSGRIVVSSTEEFATFFPDEPWNPSTEVRIEVDGSQILGRDGNALDADNDGTPGGTITADFRTLPITRIPGTDVFGYVYDAYNRNPDGSNIPLQGVEIRLDALPDVVAVTDENGYFILEDVPAPEFYVYIDGSEVAGLTEGSQYASLGKAFHSIPGQSTQLFMDGEPFDVYLPLMSETDIVTLSTTEDTNVGFGSAAQDFLEQQFPDVDPNLWQQTQVTFIAGAAQDDQGIAATQATIIPVDPVRLPAPLPPNLNPDLVISIQAGGPNGFNREAEGGATNFDIPAPIQFPNLEGLAPGEKSLLWTFNHDAGDWEVIGTGTVSEDGKSIISDEGVGIRAPGWHFTNSGSPTDGPDDPPCLDTGEILETVIDAGQAAANCAKDFFEVRKSIDQIFQVASEIRSLVGSAQNIYNDIQNGTLNTASGVANALAGINASKSAILTGIDLFKRNASPIDRALKISKCIGQAIGFAENLCNRLNTPNSPCSGPVVDFVCIGLAAASSTLDKVNNLIEKANDGLTRLGLAALCGTIDQIASILGATPAQPSSLNLAFATSNNTDDAIPPEVLDLLLQLVSQGETTSAEFDSVEELGTSLQELDTDSENLKQGISQVRAEFETAPANSPFLVEYNNFELRGVTNGAGKISIVLPPNTEFTIKVYDPATNTFGEVSGITAASGSTTRIPTFVMQSVEDGTFADTDAEGLVDQVEKILGTSIDDADTDNDLINDFAEVQQGIDPLGGQGFPTGIIANLNLPGTAQGLVIEETISGSGEQTAYVATGSNGLAIVDASDFDQPVLLGQLDLPGDATDVDVDTNLQIAAVATGEGLQLVDISDGMMPELITTVNVSASQVEVADGLAYIATNNSIRVIDLISGETAQVLPLSDTGSITGMAREGETLYTMSSRRTLQAIDISNLQMELKGSLVLPDGASELFVADGIAYAASRSNFRGGFATVDVTDVDNLTLISGSDVTSPFIAPQTKTIANGSGLGLSIGSNGLDVVDILNLSDLSNTNDFLTRFELSDDPNDIVIASGIAYIASDDGLQVLNYLSFDTQNTAPTIVIESSITDQDPETEGIQIIEGSSIPLQLDITDDVQVRNVELLIDGQVVTNDVSSPFDFFAISPQLSTGFSSATVQVRAFDTGGNSALSNELVFDLLPDTIGPNVIGSTPGTDGAGFQISSISLAFDEAIDSSLLDLAGFTLTHLGTDGILGSGDDQLIELDSVVAPADNRIAVLPGQRLAPGEYQLTIDNSIIADRAGNNLETPFELDFLAIDAPEDTTVWISKEDGNWNDPNKWNTRSVPGADEDVFISIANADPLITISDDVQVRSIFTDEAVLITDGSGFFNSTTVALSGEAIFNSTLTTEAGGAFGGDVNFTVSGTDASLTIIGLADLSRGDFVANNGATIRLENFEGGFGAPGQQIFRATGIGSLIDLSAVTTLAGAQFTNSELALEAIDGGQVLVNNVAEISSGMVRAFADGTDSLVDLSALTSFSRTGRGTSGLEARNGGTVAVENLTSLDGINLNLDGTGTLATSQITTYTRGTITADGTNPDLSSITNADDAGFVVRNGGTISLPNVTNYVNNSADFFQAFRAEGENSTLDLSNITTFRGATFVNDAHTIAATSGGQIDLSSLTQITGGLTQISSEGENSTIDLSSLLSFVKTGRGTSNLVTQNSGVILAANLATLDDIELTADNAFLELIELTDYSGENLAQAINGGVLGLLNLDTLLDGSLIARADGDGSTVNVANVVGITEEELNGGVVNLI